VARRFLTARPLLGSALAGLTAFVVFVGICMIAGEKASVSIAGGVFVGVAVGGALGLAHVMSRRQVR
jgi:hypothetical protein